MAKESELEKIGEGREAEIFSWEGGTVLRLYRDGRDEQHVEREAAAMKAARGAGVSVPAVHGLATVDGRPGLIMDRVDGPDLLTLLGRRPQSLFQVARIAGELHAQLHDVEAPDGIPELRPALRQRIGSSGLVPPELAELGSAKLDGLPDGNRLCHGDYHPGNIILTDDGPVIIDWTGVSKGDPAADVQRTQLMTRLGEPPPGSPLILRLLALVGRRVLLGAYFRAYGKKRPLDRAAVEAWAAPVAANRLVDGIEEERSKVLRLLEGLRDVG